MIPDLAAVTAPPYDVISPQSQESLYQKSHYNVVRLILNQEEDPYAAAAAHLSQWISEGVLVRDPRPAIYLTEEVFPHPSGSKVTRRGFIALAELHDFSDGMILRHEKTLLAPKRDRLRLIQACRANLSPIFTLYLSRKRGISEIVTPILADTPLLSLSDDRGVEHRLWRVEAPRTLSSIAEEMVPQSVLIADGHHRYETALEYRDWARSGQGRGAKEAPYDFVMTYFCDASDSGLVILPFHRLLGDVSLDASQALKGIRSDFETRELPIMHHRAELEEALRGATFGFMLRGIDRFYLAFGKAIPASSPLQRLSVVRLHSQVFRGVFGIGSEDEAEGKRVSYTEDPIEAIRAIDSGMFQAAFFLNPPSVEEIWDVSLSGETMPQKSTYFYPKLLTGLTIHPFNGD
jgi:uncharacterized protein (DUF1015 family)